MVIVLATAHIVGIHQLCRVAGLGDVVEISEMPRKEPVTGLVRRGLA
jgi:hypothetical protein